MTAVIGGSKSLVSGVLLLSEVQDMYAIRIPGEVSLRTNEALRAYARLEYPREDVHWLLAASRRASKPKVPRRRLPLLARRARPTHAPVAHKGSPRLAAEEGPSSA